jgi:hypothetical protein
MRKNWKSIKQSTSVIFILALAVGQNVRKTIKSKCHANRQKQRAANRRKQRASGRIAIRRARFSK